MALFIYPDDSDYERTRKEVIEIYTKLDKEWKKWLKIAEEMLKKAKEDKTNPLIGALDFHIM